MSAAGSCLYHGDVVHRRRAPVRHALRYRVYNVFADIEELAPLGRRLRLFSYNRFNLFSIDDRDHGPGDGTSIRDHVWALVKAAENGTEVARIFMFCYPRVLGFVFNPITVYYGFDADGELRLMVYEVNNTFGERHSYVIPVGDSLQHSCSKALYVSPFNAVEGHYDFNVGVPGDKLTLGITLTTPDGPRLTAWFSGSRMPLTDRKLLRSFLGLPLLPLKIVGGIHWEAFKLWVKGLRFQKRPAPPTTQVTFSTTRKGRK